MDTAFWQQIKANDYALPQGYTLAELTPPLLDYLASPDPARRIGIAYDILEQWIREQDRYSDADLTAMRGTLLANLRQGIGEAGTDSVFLRSFSLWILAFILQRDARVPFMPGDDFDALADAVFTYMRDEQDLRGWAGEKGWVHTTAHIASLLGVMVQHPHAGAALDERTLTAVAHHMTRPTGHTYGHGEDERMAHTVYLILNADRVGMDVWRGWLGQLAAIMERASAGMPFQIETLHAYMNVRNLLRCLYFPIELCVAEQPVLWPEFRPGLLGTIREVGLC